MFPSDTELFNTISELLREQHGPLCDERRSNERHAYETVQLLAFYDGITLPSQADFQLVRCRDLSPTGFSYFGPLPPTEHVVVALGGIPFKFVRGKVVRKSPQRTDDGLRYVVGCQFTGRIDC